MRKRIIFIPADSIENEVSRSYFIARSLSEQYDVFMLRWYDPQTAIFNNKRSSKLYTLTCFIKSLVSNNRIVPSVSNNIHFQYLPIMTHMVIHKLIGLTWALMLSRWFNRKILRKVINKIDPDVVFNADGCDYYPVIDGRHKTLIDIQDDFNEDDFRTNYYHKKYNTSNFRKSVLNFIVSENASRKFERKYGASFRYLPNGADFKSMRSIPIKVIHNYREKLMIGNRIVISYIGSDVWYDKELMDKIYSHFEDNDKIHFLMVGNLPKSNFRNVTFTGPVPAQESYIYYNLSDIGGLFKSSEGSDFLYNSMPLKIIQYSAVGKPVISPPINWIEEEQYSNVKIVCGSSEGYISAIENWENLVGLGIDHRWESHSWTTIVDDHIVPYIED